MTIRCEASCYVEWNTFQTMSPEIDGMHLDRDSTCSVSPFELLSVVLTGCGCRCTGLVDFKQIYRDDLHA